MSFSGLGFIFHFFPILLLVYYITPVKRRGVIMLIGSLVFYTITAGYYVILLIFSVLVNYFFYCRIYNLGSQNTDLDEIDYIEYLDEEIIYDKEESAMSLKKRAWLIVSIIYNILILFIFKYYDSLALCINKVTGIALPAFNLLMPIGISFYSFQILSFIFDAYRKDKDSKISLFNFAIYATSFIQITSGPIIRYDSFKEKLENPSLTRPKYLEEGITWFITGLSFKVLLADKMASLWNDIWRVGAHGMDVATAWLGAFGYSMEIYFDFFGYSLMAIGVGMMLGFNIPWNFNEPYSAKSMSSFWRKWHITLGSWFRDYVYIPLGGNRCKKIKMLLNIFIVWILTAIWHGASLNFLIWGLFLFILLSLEKLLYGEYLEKSKLVGHVYMIFVIPISWIIFGISDVRNLYEYLLRMFGFPIEGMVINGMSKFLSLLVTYWWLIIIGIVFCTPYPIKYIKKYIDKWFIKVAMWGLFWLSIYELTISGNNPFIYFSF